MHLPTTTVLAALAAIVMTSDLSGQSPRPPAAPEDVASVGAIVTASYDVISGEAGEARDWDRERSLFHISAMHKPTRIGPDGKPLVDVQSIDDFIERAGGFFATTGFHEYEVTRTIQRFGNVAQVWSTYEWKRSLDGPVGGRGINSFQLFFDGDRWWIMSMIWQQESDSYPVPPEYLAQPEQ